ncbi:MAG: DUF4270 family protein [Chitinophagaceae bacterium]|nr:DUF4270 family protein [Chitinophagaceae bacterium]
MKQFFSILLIGVFFSFLLLFLSCTRINEATELGSDLIPAVDNITTFDTTLDVETYNETFSSINDSTRSTLTNEQFLGYIGNDPLFGKTTASMFFELKPGAFKFTFPFKKDSLIALDSVVLVLSYRETYGDSTVPQSVSVSELSQLNKFNYDSAYLLTGNNFQLSSQLGTTTFTPNQLDDSVFLFREKSRNQLRIRLDDAFGERLLNYDTTNAYASDSAFKSNFAGFAVIPSNMGNAIMGFALADTNTKLALYYRFTKNGKADTSVTYFRATRISASANDINRDYSGSEVEGYLGGATQDNLLFLQNSPGIFARLRVPALSNLSNRIVHRAELIVQQVYDPSDALFPPPAYLFVDAYDTTKNNYRTLPFTFQFEPNGNINTLVLGMSPMRATDAFGNSVAIWRLNLTRYVQHVVNRTTPNYELRLSAPFLVNDYFQNGTFDQRRVISINPTYAKGRVRLGGGSHPTQKLQLRIIYSRL